MSDTALVALRDVSLVIQSRKIISSLNMDIYPGQIHGLIGDRGSGKTSIGTLLSLDTIPDRGKVFWRGEKIDHYSYRSLQNPGIQMIYQDGGLLGHFTVAENLFLPEKILRPFPFNRRKKMQNAAGQLIREYGFDIDPNHLFIDLTMSEQVVIEILRCIIKEPDFLVIDEALEKLNGEDYEKIVTVLKKESRAGLSILCISHRIDDIYGFAETVSVVRNGSILLTDSTKKIDRLNLIKLCYTQVTRNKKSEDVNKEFYQILRYNEAILKSLPISLVVVDEKNKIKMINDQGLLFFKVGSDEYLNLDLNTIIKDEESFRRIQDSINREATLYNLKIEKTICNIKVFPIFDGKFSIGNIIILEDISEQEEMRHRLNLSENLASLGLLAAGVAHEINNPLEIIYNYLNFLKMDPEEQQQKKVVRLLEEEMDGIKYIVSNLMSFSGKPEANFEDFDLNQLVKQTFSLLKPSAKERNIDCRFLTSREEIIVGASKIEIRQVLLNLIKNSFEVLKSDGCIEVETEQDSQSTILRVRDNGPGIREDNIRDILLPFYSNKKEARNMGLGLTVSYNIIKKYEGEFSFNNLQDRGCEFVVKLPR